MSKTNKSALAREMEVSRGSLYYKSKLDLKDQIIKEKILSVLDENSAYGHKRIAIELGYNKKRILRIMKKYENWMKLLCPIAPNVFWASDFTYLWFQGKFYYLATVIDTFSREIIEIAMSPFHNKELVMEPSRTTIKETILVRRR